MENGLDAPAPRGRCRVKKGASKTIEGCPERFRSAQIAMSRQDQHCPTNKKSPFDQQG